MRRFRVHLEGSAAIGVELEIKASSHEEAEAIAEAKYGQGAYRTTPLIALVENFLDPSLEAVEGYASASDLPIKHVAVALDEHEFEVVDSWEEEEAL